MKQNRCQGTVEEALGRVRRLTAARDLRRTLGAARVARSSATTGNWKRVSLAAGLTLV